jgi:hypothetical protein
VFILEGGVAKDLNLILSINVRKQQQKIGFAG